MFSKQAYPRFSALVNLKYNIIYTVDMPVLCRYGNAGHLQKALSLPALLWNSHLCGFVRILSTTINAALQPFSNSIPDGHATGTRGDAL